MRKWLWIAVLVVSCLAGSVYGAEDANVKTARGILTKHQDAVIWVSGVMKSQMTGMGVQLGHEQEQEVKALGTVIDPSGLTVVSLFMLDPMSMMMEYMSAMSGEEGVGFKTQLSDMKLSLPDGTEIPAKLVLKDPDLGLGFLIPEPPEGKSLPKFTSLNLEESAKADVLDELVLVGRLADALDRSPSVTLVRVAAVIKKPRTLYVGDLPFTQGLGTPAFTMEGKVLGITIIPKGPGVESGFGEMMSGATGCVVVVPAEDVMEIARQALQGKQQEE